MIDLAPIVLFVYKRPWHTIQTIEALMKNKLASESDLFIYSDAPKNEGDYFFVQQVRDYINNVTGFKKVTVIERTKNWGLANSIIDGVTTILNDYGKIIVVEDDLVTSPFFLDYMNNALDVYQDQNKVMHISGYMFPVNNIEKIPATFFYRATTCWGWGTWKRAWDDLEFDSHKLLSKIHHLNLEYEFDVQGTYDYTSMLESQSQGLINSWAIRWYANVFLKNGLCLHPSRSFVHNIGFDGSGSHCDPNCSFAVDISNVKLLDFYRYHDISESPEALYAIKEFNRQLIRPLYIRIYSKLIRVIRKFILNEKRL